MPDQIKSDLSRIKQVLFILVYNAIKYTNGGYVHIKISATHSADEDKHNLIIKITDSGCGMPS